jgi:hypothetical protein
MIISNGIYYTLFNPRMQFIPKLSVEFEVTAGQKGSKTKDVVKIS